MMGMVTPNTEAPQNTEAIEPNRPAESISRLYVLLARCFSYPQEGFCESMRDKEMEDTIKGLVEGLPFKMDTRGIPSPTIAQDEMENLYINTFDMNMGRPLYESAYTASKDVYEELLRFYEHFDVKLNEKEKDYPDNLAVELEFMAFLVKKESGALKLGKDPNPYRRAQLDFLERHLDRWVHLLDKHIQRNVAEAFYKGMSSFLAEFLRKHLSYLKERLQRGVKDEARESS